MTHRVLKSQVAGIADFDAKVATFAAEKTQHAVHMAKVGVDPEYVAHPAPQASHPLIEASIREDGARFVPDFEIVNDDPSPAHVLRAKKDVLLGNVMVAEREAEAAVVPLGKRRHFAFRETDIRMADAKIRDEILRRHAEDRLETMRTLSQQHAAQMADVAPKKADALRAKQLEEMTAALGTGLTADEVLDRVEKSRSPENAAFVADQDSRRARLEAIARHGAKLQHEIEDLTVEGVDGWKPAPFPT